MSKEWCDRCSMDCEYDEQGNCRVCGDNLKEK